MNKYEGSQKETEQQFESFKNLKSNVVKHSEPTNNIASPLVAKKSNRFDQRLYSIQMIELPMIINKRSPDKKDVHTTIDEDRNRFYSNGSSLPLIASQPSERSCDTTVKALVELVPKIEVAKSKPKRKAKDAHRASANDVPVQAQKKLSLVESKVPQTKLAKKYTHSSRSEMRKAAPELAKEYMTSLIAKIEAELEREK